MSKWHQLNKERILAKHKIYYGSNKEKILSKHKAYRKSNKEVLKTKQKAYYERNKERRLAWAKDYYERNKEKLKAIVKLYQNQKHKTGSQRWRYSSEAYAWTQAVYKRANYTCEKCNKTNCLVHAHHKIPYKDAPELKYDIDNGECLCSECHVTRHPELKHLISKSSCQ